MHQYERFQELVRTTFQVEPLSSDEEIQIPTAKALMSDAEIDIALSTLETGMKEKMWFQNPSLSLRELAKTMDINSNKLSWLLNERIGQNFNEYVNSFRLENFKLNALDPANSHLTLLALAYDNGFNSKTVFNAFFKKIEGMTPKAWLKSQQN